MFSDLRKAIFQTFADQRLRRVLIRAMLMTLGLVIVASIGAGFLVPWVVDLTAGLFGYDVSTIGWLSWAVGGVSGIGMLIMSFLLFPALTTLISGLFLDEISSAVDARYYPDLPPARQIPLMETIRSSIRFTLVSFGLNLLFLPVYIIFLVFGIGPIVYFALNGYLISREYYEQAAFRRSTRQKADEIRQRNRTALWGEGAALAVVAAIPFINLALPVIGTATMTHFVQRKKFFKGD